MLEIKVRKIGKNFKKYRNLYSKGLKMDKSEQDKKFSEDIIYTKSSKHLWKTVYKKSGWIKDLSPNFLVEDGKIIRNKLEMSNVINTYYKEKIEDLVREIPVTNSDPLGILKYHMNRWVGTEKYNKTFKFNPVTLEDVKSVVNDLSNTCATGDDEIHMKIIKDGIDKLGVYILRIVNLSINKGVFPNIWKLMKIIPNYKNKGKRTDKSSFRPVCLLSNVSKILEKLLTLQMVKYFESNGLFHPHQFAYRKDRSTVEAMLLLHELWMDAIDKR